MMKNKYMIILVLLFACASNESEQKTNEIVQLYEYAEDFNFYFEENFDLDLDDLNKERLFVVPVSSCTPCVNEVLTNLQNNDCENAAVLFVGETHGDHERQEQINRISEKMIAYNDLKSDLYNYQIDIGKPCVLFLGEENVKKLPLDFSNNEETKAILGWK